MHAGRSPKATNCQPFISPIPPSYFQLSRSQSSRRGVQKTVTQFERPLTFHAVILLPLQVSKYRRLSKLVRELILRYFEPSVHITLILTHTFVVVTHGSSTALALLSSEEQAAIMATFMDGPALEPPPGVIPNFDQPGGSHDLGYGIVLLGSIVAGVAVLLRMTSRALLRVFCVEDALLISALVSISTSAEMICTEQLVQGLFAGHSYVIYELAIFPGIKVHLWNIQSHDFISILHVSVVVIRISSLADPHSKFS